MGIIGELWIVSFPAIVMCLRSDNPLVVAIRTRDHSLCRICQMAPTAKLLKGPPGMNEAQGVFVPVEFALRSRLRWLGVAVAIRCPFSSSVSVCFGNDPSTLNEILRTGKANRRVAPRAGSRAAMGRVFFSCRSDYGMKLKSSILARNCVREIATKIVIVVAHKRTSVSHIKRDESSDENISRRSTGNKSSVASSCFIRDCICIRDRKTIRIIQRFILVRMDKIEKYKYLYNGCANLFLFSIIFRYY